MNKHNPGMLRHTAGPQSERDRAAAQIVGFALVLALIALAARIAITW